MLLQHASEQDKRARMEVEANRFSSLILIPPPFLRLRLKGDPNLRQLTELALEFEVSKEAMARAYASYHHEVLAFVVTENGIVRRFYKHLKFPYVSIDVGRAAPKQSLISRSHFIRPSSCAPALRWRQGQALRVTRNLDAAGRGRSIDRAGSEGMTASLPHQGNPVPVYPFCFSRGDA
jgi:hypothetical protein